MATQRSDASTSQAPPTPPPAGPAAIARPIPAPVPTPVRLSTPEGFIAGALAACGSVTFTNQFEVAKTRLQLDGELQSRASSQPGAQPYKRVYNNALDALAKTYKTEGIKGLSRGLTSAYAYQVFLNGSRLGLYEPFRRTLNKALGKGPNDQSIGVNLTSGASSGVVGAVLGNPLFLVKARMQAYSPTNPVGAQHCYKSPLQALIHIFKTEGGVRGLYRGVDAAMLRTAMGSSVQLPSYNLAKSYIVHWDLLPAQSIWTYLLASTFSGGCVCIVMSPADTVLSRMYNQSKNSIGPDGKPRGLLYNSLWDCFYKTYKAEGIAGWYKGSFAHLLRIAPHTVLTLVFNEQIVNYYSGFKAKMQAKAQESGIQAS